jgi:hypothetical protein
VPTLLLRRSCEAAQQLRGAAWRCFFAQAAWRHLATPAIFHEYLYDSANLGYDGAAWGQYEDFRGKLQGSFTAAPADEGGGGGCPAAGAAWAATSGGSGGTGTTALQACSSSSSSSAAGNASDAARRPNVFAPACHLHEMIDGAQFTTSHVGGQRFTDVLASWFAGNLSSVFLLDDSSTVRSADECGVDAAASKQLSDVLLYIQN